MRSILFIATIIIGCANSIYASVSFSGSTQQVIEVIPEKSTGLDKIYVAHSLNGVTIDYTSETGNNAVKWYTYKEKGGGYAEAINDIVYDGTLSHLQNPQGDCGYIIEDGSNRYYFWLVNYENHIFNIGAITFPEEQDCGIAILNVDANCEPIKYYTINGVPKKLSRDIEVIYSTLEWSEESNYYQSKEVSTMLDNLDAKTTIEAPLCNTTFTVKGDKFQAVWGEERTYTSDLYTTKSIEARVTATQTEKDNDNEKISDDESLGGSAPAEIEFASVCTDAVMHKEWLFAHDAGFKNIYLRLNEETTTYTFQEEGEFFVKFIASNEDASCQYESEVFTISIGESMLECPNAFSPNATEGINDYWKVSYKSIISFECWIFDRYGNKIISFKDPAQGWDGKNKGKFVKPGVYFYVIEAKGADGKEYKLKGDINILKSSK